MVLEFDVKHVAEMPLIHDRVAGVKAGHSFRRRTWRVEAVMPHCRKEKGMTDGGHAGPSHDLDKFLKIHFVAAYSVRFQSYLRHIH